MRSIRPDALIAGLACALALGACGESPSAPNGQPAELTSLPRALTTAERQVVGAANAFSFSLWNRLVAVQRDSNVFVSPLSASFALGMTLNGAANQTYDEMRSALQFGTATQHDINDGFHSLIALIAMLDPSVTTGIANSIWYRNTFTFSQAFFDTTRTYFDAEVSGLNFADATGSLAAINGWVNTKTHGVIPAVVDRIDDSTVMFLINAIYFNGSWREKFDLAATRDATFLTSNGAMQPMRLMHRTADMLYTESPMWQAVDLPYGNGAFTMTVVLPTAASDVEAVAASLTAGAWASLTAALTKREVDLSLPKLRLTYDRLLNDDLKALGMVVPFVGDVADFTRMSPAGDHLFISLVKQKAFVDVNEEGTQAAAATTVEVGTTSAPVATVMRVDHPYVFVLRERLTGTVLFMGKVTAMPSGA